jgi:hypothetical protein
MDIEYLGQVKAQRIKWPAMVLKGGESGYMSAGHDERDVFNKVIT